MATTFVPGIIGSTIPVFFAILSEIILVPASPKPWARRAPIFTIDFSRITVSYGPSSPSFFEPSFWQRIFVLNQKKNVFFSFAVSFELFLPRISFSNSYVASSCAASIGFLAIEFTFLIICSIGRMTILWASRLKNKLPNPSTRQTKIVRPILSAPVIFVLYLRSKIATKLKS